MKKIIMIIALVFGNLDIVMAAGNKYINCGGAAIPAFIPPITRTIIILLQIVVPLVLIIFGSLDFVKATIAKDESAMNKHRQTFIKRLGAAAVVFFVITIAKMILSFVANDSAEVDMSKCLDCIIESNNHCSGITVTPFDTD
ncbi:MAG: hypothetical protein RSB77_03785 [Bacilli bacterium]